MSDIGSVNVAVLGLGTMGASMAANLAAAGFMTRGWNRTSDRPGVRQAGEAGVELHGSPSDAVEGADFVLSCVTDIAALETVFSDELVDSLAEETVVIDTSTIGPKNAIEFGQRLASMGVGFIDAPVSGGDIGAKNGTLTVMAGGSAENMERSAGIFEVIGGSINHCGPIGSGQSLKMVNQVLCALSTVAVAEAMALAKAQGLDLSLVSEVCGSGAGGSWSLEKLGPRVVEDDFAPGFRTRDLDKDLRLALSGAVDNDLELPVVTAAHQQFIKSLEGHPDAGTQAVYLNY